jgi:hypothetical protein
MNWTAILIAVFTVIVIGAVIAVKFLTKMVDKFLNDEILDDEEWWGV